MLDLQTTFSQMFCADLAIRSILPLRIQSHGEGDRVQISEATFRLVNGNDAFSMRTTRFRRFKGKIPATLGLNHPVMRKSCREKA